jgi:CHAT domain-containing protein/Tfp pilus assembly protein PilF
MTTSGIISILGGEMRTLMQVFVGLRLVFVCGAICVALMGPSSAMANPLAQYRTQKATELTRGLLEDQDAGRFEAGLKKGYEALELYKKIHGPNHPDVGRALNNIAVLLGEAGDLEGSVKVNRQALEIYTSALGESHDKTITAMANLAVALHTMTELTEAERLYRRVLELRSRTLGPQHIDLAFTMGSLGELLREAGKYDEAEKLQKQALKIQRTKFGDDHRDVIGTLMYLGQVYEDRGQYDLAEEIFIQNTKGYEKALGPEHPLTGRAYFKLAGVYHSLGDYERAEPMYKRSFKIILNSLGDGHPFAGAIIGDMGGLYEDMGNHEKAARGYKMSLGIRIKIFGPSHPLVAETLNNLGSLLGTMGQYEDAEKMLTMALEINREVYGESDHRTAAPLNNLGELYKEQKQFAKAVPSQRKALEFDRAVSASGKGGITAHNLAMTLEALGEIPEAIVLHEEAREVEELMARRLLTIGSQEQKAAFMKQINGSTDMTTSLHLQLAPDNPRAAKLALETLLRRKGRALDAQTQTLKLLRSNMDAQGQQLIDELLSLRTMASNIVNSESSEVPPDVRKKTLDDLAAKVDGVERELAQKSRTFARQHAAVEVTSVAAKLPQDAVLAEFTVYQPYDPKAREFKPAHYGLYVLKPDGTVLGRDLGPVEAIDAMISTVRGSITNSKMGSQPFDQQTARALHSALVQPIQMVAPAVQHIVIAPDGALNILPFEALVEPSGKYLVQSKLITYLTTGRDLLGLGGEGLPARSPAVLIANPDYNANLGIAQANVSPTNAATRGMSLTTNHLWSQLPGALAEAEAISKILPQSSVVSGAAATESMVKKVRGPEVLHVATHGAFKTEGMAGAPADPMFRSALIFAGANTKTSGLEDGYLSAWEASTLDLWGTKMAVLSACETGLGDVRTGKGVFGLRRALVLAGSRSQVMSLWSVSDDATKALMTDFYQRMLAGNPSGTALRDAKLSLLNKKGHSHPFFWASFLLAGEWRPVWDNAGGGNQVH